MHVHTDPLALKRWEIHLFRKKQFTEYCRIKSYHYRRALKFIVYFLHLTLLKKLWTMDYCELGNDVSLKAKLL